MEQRRHRHHHLAHAFDVPGQEVEAAAGHGLQDRGAVRIDHALGISRRPRGIADGGGGFFVELRPGEAGVVLSSEKLLVAMDVYKLRLRHPLARGHHDVSLDRLQLRRDRLDDRQRGAVDEQQAVFGVVDDVDELLGKQPRIDGVQHIAHARRGVEHLEMAVGIPGQRADAVALLHAETLQGQRHALDAWESVRIGVAMDVALDLARDDLRLAVIVGGVLDQAADQERHVHHQSLHHFLRIAMSLHGACDLRARLPERHAPFTQKTADVIACVTFSRLT
ncbi:hypothetical protein ACVJGC_000557 [Bradyrhizobium diazoefficiens]